MNKGRDEEWQTKPLDGVDGQFAGLRGEQSVGGAFLDSVLDRYSDGAMVIGLTVYLIGLPNAIPLRLLTVLGSLELIGSHLVSYLTARAESLGIQLDVSTLANTPANKGTRTTVTILSGFGSLFWPPMPIVALFYLALYINLVVVRQLFRILHHGPGCHFSGGSAPSGFFRGALSYQLTRVV